MRYSYRSTMIIQNEGWQTVLADEFNKDYYVELCNKLEQAYDDHPVYPAKEDVFSAFELVDYDEVKVVILGQDTYHGPGQAHGLSFSVKKGVKIPPSLRNMYKELKSDLGIEAPDHGYLEAWAKQGILMFNAVLSVDEGKAGSHKKYGWHTFTDAVITQLNQREEGVVFVLWGNFAISKKKLITASQHRIVESVHPSPLSASRGFLGSKPYSKINGYLEELGYETIEWCLETEDDGQVKLDI